MASRRFVPAHLQLRNDGNGPLTVFPEATQLSQVGGWVGPWWFARLTRDGTDHPEAIQELRTYYGPPGQPPNSEFWDSAKRVLRPGAKVTSRLTACWIPAAQLKPENLALSTIDPQGMDGIAKSGLNLDGVHVLALQRSCAEVEKDRQARPDFLRAGVVVFVYPGSTSSLRFAYFQDENVFFKTTKLTSTRSAPIELTIL